MLDKARTEAFSDGVIAIAITLLVLDLAVPARSSLHGQSLWAVLGQHWASYLAYAVSFLTIGIIWINHHALFALVRRVDRWVLFANLLLLMIVVLMPFTTSLLAEYLTSPGAGSNTAAVVYAANNLAMALAFVALFLAINRVPGLTEDGAAIRSGRTLVRFGLGILVYAATVVVALISAPATLAVAGATAIYYCFDQLATPAADGASDP